MTRTPPGESRRISPERTFAVLPGEVGCRGRPDGPSLQVRPAWAPGLSQGTGSTRLSLSEALARGPGVGGPERGVPITKVPSKSGLVMIAVTSRQGKLPG